MIGTQVEVEYKGNDDGVVKYLGWIKGTIMDHAGIFPAISSQKSVHILFRRHIARVTTQQGDWRGAE